MATRRRRTPEDKTDEVYDWFKDQTIAEQAVILGVLRQMHKMSQAMVLTPNEAQRREASEAKE